MIPKKDVRADGRSHIPQRCLAGKAVSAQWCQSAQRVNDNVRPRMTQTATAMSAQCAIIGRRKRQTKIPLRIPALARRARGIGATADGAGSNVPQVYDRPLAGKGTSEQRTTRPDLVDWFRAIQERLKGVIVLNRSWESLP